MLNQRNYRVVSDSAGKCVIWWSLLQQSTLACLRHVVDDGETAADTAVHRRVTSSLDSLFSLLSSSVDVTHCRVVHSVIANFVSLLSCLVTTANIDFIVKVFIATDHTARQYDRLLA